MDRLSKSVRQNDQQKISNTEKLNLTYNKCGGLWMYAAIMDGAVAVSTAIAINQQQQQQEIQSGGLGAHSLGLGRRQTS